MVRIIEAQLTAVNFKPCIVVSRFNSFITERLLVGAEDAFLRHGGDPVALTVIKVPGAFEIPVVAQKAAKSGLFNGIVALGAVIRGDTPHFDYVASEVTKGLAQVQLATQIPVGFGILTCDTVDQAVDRAGTKSGNKGFETMVATIELFGVLNLIPQ
ncbi:MAG: 6,7-dimethyl-8-ribityllumazine synthase [Deltaproteobacteria bacterium]|jgi:6,7-dimethyl-8-ribityllumazine synthase|nr:6,7-dimethyl-8-ribityllumazine synthase [Deltaproteobacteria bacterium]